MKRDIKLLIVDDSKVMRDAISGIFASDHLINVVGEACDGIEALEMIEQLNPDVITLDVSMPRMDGITTLKHVMVQSPKPIVMLSSLTMEGAKVAYEALRYGAVDFISKPSALGNVSLAEQEAEIRSKIEYAASVEMGAVKLIRNSSDASSYSSMEHKGEDNIGKLITLGAAEGGYGALLKIVPRLHPCLSTAYLVALYVAPEHLDSFANYLNENSQVFVKRAVHGESIKPGICYLSSGTDYMTVHSQGDGFIMNISPAPFASRKGAIDMLFFSAAELLKDRCGGVILSGLGGDGVEGLEEIIHMGGEAIIQDPNSCLCKDMSLEALALNPTAKVIPDMNIAEELSKYVVT